MPDPRPGRACVVLARPPAGLRAHVRRDAPRRGLYIWATYLRLEHYLLVPWLLLGDRPRGRARGPRARPRALVTRLRRTGPAGPVADGPSPAAAPRRRRAWSSWSPSALADRHRRARLERGGPERRPVGRRLRRRASSRTCPRTRRSSRRGMPRRRSGTAATSRVGGRTCSSSTTRTSCTRAGARARRASRSLICSRPVFITRANVGELDVDAPDLRPRTVPAGPGRAQRPDGRDVAGRLPGRPPRSDDLRRLTPTRSGRCRRPSVGGGDHADGFLRFDRPVGPGPHERE